MPSRSETPLDPDGAIARLTLAVSRSLNKYGKARRSARRTGAPCAPNDDQDRQHAHPAFATVAIVAPTNRATQTNEIFMTSSHQLQARAGLPRGRSSPLLACERHGAASAAISLSASSREAAICLLANSSIDLPPICPSTICPMMSLSVAPIAPPTLPPLGTSSCQQARVSRGKGASSGSPIPEAVGRKCGAVDPLAALAGRRLGMVARFRQPDHQRLEQPRGLQKIDEERQLPERRNLLLLTFLITNSAYASGKWQLSLATSLLLNCKDFCPAPALTSTSRTNRVPAIE